MIATKDFKIHYTEVSTIHKFLVFGSLDAISVTNKPAMESLIRKKLLERILEGKNAGRIAITPEGRDAFCERYEADTMAMALQRCSEGWTNKPEG